MAGVWKRNGTIAVTKGSKKVVGTGTTFADPKNAAAKGHLLVMVTGTAVDLYEVDYSESNTVFYLVDAYRGDTGTGKAYAIDTSRTDSIPEFARRLNATLGAYQQQSDAFQALLTSNAATIDVTAPDGTKHTMIPWKRVTSEGEGQAARAKAEADKAQAAAATAVNVVRESTLPVPDVWAPLSDSLRLITGFGREVKVGVDVVGRYVSFERASAAWYFDKSGVLRQAAINEPRFEAKGLLIEGPSTNLHKFSWFDGTYRSDQVAYNVNYTAVSDPSFSFTVGRFSRDSRAATHTFVNRNITAQEGTYCASALVKDAGAGSAEVWLRDQMANGNFSRTNFNFLTGQIVHAQGGNFTQCSGGAIQKENGWWLVWSAGTIPADVTLQNQVYVKSSVGEAGSDSEAILCAFTQIEGTPSPSSYIHTTGAAATRAADIPFIPAINGGAEMATVAVTVSVSWPSSAAPNPAPRIFSVRTAGISARAWDASIGPGSISSEINANNFGGLTNAGSVVANFKSGQVFTGIKTPAGFSTVTPSGRKDGSQGTSPGFEDAMYLGCQKGTSIRHLNGHLRDLKIWHFEATDAQIKSLR